MTRFIFSHEKAIDYLSLLLSLLFIWVIYVLGIKIIDHLFTAKTTPIIAYGISESCVANKGSLQHLEEEDRYIYVCTIPKKND